MSKKLFTVLVMLIVVASTPYLTFDNARGMMAADSMFIEPPTISFTTATASVGIKFNVTVWLNLTTAANAWQFYLTYDKSQLNATRCDYTGNGQSQWSGAFPITPVSPDFGEHNETFNYVLHGEVLKNSAVNTGAGSLSWVEFQILKAPPSGQTLASEIRLDLIWCFKSLVMDADLNMITVDFGKTLYSFAGTQPPPANFTLVITASTGGMTDPAPGKYSYASGTVVSVTAYPTLSTHQLDHWELDGINLGATNPTHVQMNANHTLTAIFTVIPDSMWIELMQGSSVSGLGAKFNVTIWLNMTTLANSWQFYLVYNRLRLMAVRCDYTGVGKSLWSGSDAVVALAPKFGFHNATYDYVLHAEVLKNNAERTGFGSLSWVEFQIIAEPLPGETLTSELRLDDKTGPFNSVVLDKDLNEIPLGFPRAEVHDIAVTGVVADRKWVYQGFSVAINVTVLNLGNFSETVTVTLYFNITANDIIGTQSITLLTGESKTLQFVWNTLGVAYCRNYTLTAVATIPADITPADNIMDGGKIKVRVLGDVNGDGKVDIKDVAMASAAFGSYGPDHLFPGSKASSKWNPDADMNGDGRIDIVDIAKVCNNFGKASP